MSGRTGRGRYLHLVYDAGTNRFLAPDLKHWTADDRWSGRGIVTAILDTGMLLAHPFIQRNLVSSVDFTGEGPNDLNGHGTMVTLLGMTVQPEARFLNVKVLDAEGRGKEQNLVEGIKWCIQHRDTYDICSINLSAGVYHVLDCEADCELCRVAHQAVLADIPITAAAGNAGPDRVPCPQRIGLERSLFFVVEAANPDTGIRLPYSGVGNVGQRDATGISMVPLKREA